MGVQTPEPLALRAVRVGLGASVQMWVDLGAVPLAQGLRPGPGVAIARQRYEQDRAAFGENAVPTQLSKHNLAEALSALDPAESERLHREVLAWKERCYGPRDIRTCTTVNSLGSLLRKRGELAEAEALLRRAMEVREAHPRESFDAAVSRDELACTLQAAGRAAEARQVRLRAGPGGLICSYERCSKTPQQAGAPLRCCSRCHATWYCGPTCQRADWASHKRVCRVEPAAEPAAEQAPAAAAAAGGAAAQ